jgi:hypothetical protein
MLDSAEVMWFVLDLIRREKVCREVGSGMISVRAGELLSRRQALRHHLREPVRSVK